MQKQPGADTLDLTRRIDRTLDGVRASLPQGVAIDDGIFSQQRCIDSAIANVLVAIRDGPLGVVVLFDFPWYRRVGLMTLAAIPLSIAVTALAFDDFGVTINMMSLGGPTVAIGELVADSIVDVENIDRNLRENSLRDRPDPALAVVFRGSAEARNSIVYSTLLVVLVVKPPFSLPGLEGRMFAPLGAS